jgi:hypothetical protein
MKVMETNKSQMASPFINVNALTFSIGDIAKQIRK